MISEGFVKTILAVALVASQMTYYEAKVTSFGCTSIDAVSQLQKVRSDQKAFQMTLMEKQMYGECVTILKGTLVQGSIEAADKSILRVGGPAISIVPFLFFNHCSTSAGARKEGRAATECGNSGFGSYPSRAIRF
jgi:hypothetical protein